MVRLEARQKNDMWIARVDGCASREAAQALSGTQLHIPHARLPATAAGVFYVEDIRGLDVVLEDGSAFGTVRAVHNFGAGDILEVRPVSGSAIFIPLTKSAVPEIDIAAGKVTICRPDELFV